MNHHAVVDADDCYNESEDKTRPNTPEEVERQPKLGLDSWLSDLSIADYPSTVLPRDSASSINASTMPHHMIPAAADNINTPLAPPVQALVPLVTRTTAQDDIALEQELSQYSLGILFEIIENVINDLLQSHLTKSPLNLEAIAAASTGDLATAANLRDTAQEVARVRVKKVRQLAIVDREVDLRIYDNYIGVLPVVHNRLLYQGIKWAPLPWTGRRWQNFVWMDMKVRECEKDWSGWSSWSVYDG